MSSASSSSSYLSSSQCASIISLCASHPRTLSSYSYGTSGFRGPATSLDSVALRMGMLGVLRSLLTNDANNHHTSSSSSCPAVGIVVTASHNLELDNGLKLVAPSGEMIEQEWESRCTAMANAIDGDALIVVINSICAEVSISPSSSARAGLIFLARDTRSSSPHLSSLVQLGASALGAKVVDYGLAATPQLHWVVRESNLNGGQQASFDMYYKTMADAFKVALNCKPSSSSSSSTSLPPLILDCANGVGATSMSCFLPLLAPELVVELRNTGAGSGGLNEDCGAEHVQKSRALPRSFPAKGLDEAGRKCAALDGDADRLVYFYTDPSSSSSDSLRLLDGDKTIALYTLFLRSLLASSGLASLVSIGIVQTAYANGASSIYMRKVLGLQPSFTNTGVKYLHHAALNFDIGVYFEANGHGTVLFSSKAKHAFENVEKDGSKDEAQRNAARCLLALTSLINQCVGDAISDMLLVEVALYHFDWSLSDWHRVYTDLPSSMLKVVVPDRSLITTTSAERVCVTPVGLQSAIDALVGVNGGPHGTRRSFVRPSGTEDIVRVYAEASTRDEVDELASEVCRLTALFAGGKQ